MQFSLSAAAVVLLSSTVSPRLSSLFELLEFCSRVFLISLISIHPQTKMTGLNVDGKRFPEERKERKKSDADELVDAETEKKAQALALAFAIKASISSVSIQRTINTQHDCLGLSVSYFLFRLGYIPINQKEKRENHFGHRLVFFFFSSSKKKMLLCLCVI